MVHGSTQAHMLPRFATFFGLLESRGLFSAFFVFHYNDILKRSVDRVLRMSLVLGFSWLCPPDGIQTTRLWQEFCGSCAGSLWTIRISFPQCVWLPYVLFSGLWEDFRLLLFSKLGSSQSWCSVCEGWVSAEAQAAVFFWRVLLALEKAWGPPALESDPEREKEGPEGRGNNGPLPKPTSRRAKCGKGPPLCEILSCPSGSCCPWYWDISTIRIKGGSPSS